MADLVSGHYAQNAALQALFGNVGNVAQSNVPVRSNLEWPIASGPLVDTAGASIAGSGVLVAVPVPVDIGQVITKISICVGATAASTPTHSFGALYSGTTVASPPLIAQSTDGGTAAIAASARFDFTLTTPQVVTAAQAPYGYIWAGYSVTASALPSAATIPVGAAATQYRWFTNTPLYFSQTAGSSLGGTAAATLVNASTLTVAPIITLS